MENADLSVSEILPVYLADRLSVSSSCKCCIFGWVSGATENCLLYVANLPR